jgi:TRAP transporter TAXI family solute receptor
MKVISISICLLGIFFFMGPASAPVYAGIYTATIGTGAVTGVYYPTGKAIAKIVNKKSKKYDIQVRVESTGGSVINVNAITMGDLEFGIVQSDRQYQAWKGIKDWKDRGPQKKLRAVCSFHPESVVLVAGDDAGIEVLGDLKRKRVNIGNPGSGPRSNAIDAMQACGIDWRRELRSESVRALDSPRLLREGRFDAFFYTVGHPNDTIKKATEGKRNVHFVPLTGHCIDQLVARWPYYTKASIPIRFYPRVRNKNNVETFGVKATFCTNADIPKKIVYMITREIFNNLAEFKTLHPAYGVLTKTNMLEALSAPVHAGAMEYFSEVGLAVPPSKLQ